MSRIELDIVESWPVALPAGTPHGSWPCSWCEQPYDVTDGWVVRHRLGGTLAQHIVCPGCAKIDQRQVQDE